MNEKIDQLMIQAGARFEMMNWVHYDDFEYQKFAELIIRECCNVCEGLQDSLDRQNWPTPYGCAVGIKEHFGIEE